MKRCLMILCVMLATLSMGAATRTHRVGTYNIRIRTSADSGNKSWDNRKSYVGKMINDLNYDVVGIQEIADATQQSELSSAISKYTLFCWGRNSASSQTSGERVGVAYKTSQYDCLDKGKFFLSANPSKSQTSWDSSVPRVSVWVKLKDKTTGEVFYFCSTHMDQEGDIARREGARINCEQMMKIAGKYPCFIVGDLNSNATRTEVHYRYSYNFEDSRFISQTTPQGSLGTSCNWSPSDCSSRIDYVYVRNAKVRSYMVSQADYSRSVTPSDHFPILVEVDLGSETRNTVHTVSDVTQLQAVINDAYVGDQIQLNNGTYSLTQPLTIPRSLIIQGMGDGTVLISSAAQLFNVSEYASFDIRDLVVDGLQTPVATTGAIAHIAAYHLGVDGCTFRNCNAEGRGLIYGIGELKMTNTIFSNNVMNDNVGCVAWKGMCSVWPVEMTGCHFLHNKACDGTVAYLESCPVIYVYGSSFIDNECRDYGIFTVMEPSLVTTARFVNNTFALNRVAAEATFLNGSKGGAAIYQSVPDASMFYLINNTIVGNRSTCLDEQGLAAEDFYGGAIFNVSGKLSLYNNIIAGNYSSTSYTSDIYLDAVANKSVSQYNIYSCKSNMAFTPSSTDFYCSDRATALSSLQSFLGGTVSGNEYIPTICQYGSAHVEAISPKTNLYNGTYVDVITNDLRDASKLGFDILNCGSNKGILEYDQSGYGRGSLFTDSYPGSMESDVPITSVPHTTIDENRPCKMFMDGHLVIMHQNTIYSITGQKY